MTQISKPSEFTLPLDALLLMLLTMAHLWFNPVSSAIAVTLLAIYIALALLFPVDENPATPSRRDRMLFTVRLAIVLFMVLIATILPMGWSILKRRAEGPATNANDGLIQTEISIQFLLEGKNPYTENYVNTPLAEYKGSEIAWTPTDSTLYHNAYLPFLFIMSVPFYLASNAWLGWYDQRFLYLLLYLVLLLLLPTLVKNPRNKLSLLCALGLNFLFAYFMSDGRNDIVILFGLTVVTILLARKHIAASALVMGLTMTVKQTAWFFLPFYLLFLLPGQMTIQKIRSLLLQLLPLFIVVTVILVPFLVWDAPSFFDDTFSYLVGASASSFPIRGWGFSNLLLAARLISSPYSTFPFGIIEIAVGIPTFVLLALRQRRNNTLRQMWFGFAVFSFAVQYFSRFFNDNYMVTIVQALVIALFIDPVPASEQSNVPSLEPSPAGMQ